MADDAKTPEDPEPPRKKSKLPMLIGLVLFLVGGGGGFFAVQSGMILGDGDQSAAGEEVYTPEAVPLAGVGFVPVEPLIINLGEGGNSQYLRFQAQLEINDRYQRDVERLLPRVVDVLNGYLRAVDIRDIEDRAALVRLRAQMLRRVQLVAGADRVRDLLVMEFVLN